MGYPLKNRNTLQKIKRIYEIYVEKNGTQNMGQHMESQCKHRENIWDIR